MRGASEAPGPEGPGRSSRTRPTKNGVGVAGVAGNRSRFLSQRRVLLRNGLAAQGCEWTFVPFHVERLSPFRGRPVTIGDDGYASTDLHHVTYTSDRFRLVRIEARHLAAEHRATDHARHQHAGPLHVDTELGLPVHLFGNVEPGKGLPEDLERLRILERHACGDGERRGLVDERAILQAATACSVYDLPFFGGQAAFGHAPGLCRRRDQHRAGGRSRLTQDPPHATRTRAAGRRLRSAEAGVSVSPIRGRPFGFDDGPIDVELFRDEHRHRGHDPLPHLEHREHDANRIVSADLYPDVWLEDAGRLRGRAARQRQIGADDQPSTCRGRGLEKHPPRVSHGFVLLGGSNRSRLPTAVRRTGEAEARPAGLLRTRLQTPRRAMDGFANPLVRSAPANVARHRRVDLSIGRARRPGQKRRRRHELSRLAVAALRHLLRHPRNLQRMG